MKNVTQLLPWRSAKASVYRKLGVATGGLFAALAIALTVFTSTASAAANCNGYVYCVYKDSTYSGTMIRYDSLNYGGCYNIEVAMNDAISSADSNAGVEIIMYEHGNCTGSSHYMYPYDDISFYSWSYMNDRTSSFRVGTLD